MRIYLFLASFILIIVGWLVEKAERFRWLRNFVAPVQNITIETLDSLKVDYAIKAGSLQGRTLISIWPNLKDPTVIEYIGRSIIYQEFQTDQIQNNIQLIAYAKDKIVVDKWTIVEAKIILNGILTRRLFILGTIIFWIGLISTFISGLIEFLS